MSGGVFPEAEPDRILKEMLPGGIRSEDMGQKERKVPGFSVGLSLILGEVVSAP